MEKKFIRAIFPGSFDPITKGHLDVIERGRVIFDELIIAIGNSPEKKYLFSLDQRKKMVEELVADMPRVTVDSFKGLMVEYAAKQKVDVILRGLRSLTDVHYEFRLAMTNRAVADIETVFVMASAEYGFTSSTLIREVASLGGDISKFIPEQIYERLQKQLKDLRGIK
jgi:pantetheine-phosphate adenylyltransferase